LFLSFLFIFFLFLFLDGINFGLFDLFNSISFCDFFRDFLLLLLVDLLFLELLGQNLVCDHFCFLCSEIEGLFLGKIFSFFFGLLGELSIFLLLGSYL
jgi:hypothetical protein